MADSTVTVSLGSGADTLATAGKIAVRRVVEGSKGDMLVLSDWREYTLGPDPLVLDDIEVGVMYESRELQPRGESRFWVAPATATPYADLDFVIPLPATPGILGDALIDGVLSNSASDAYATLEQFVIDHPGPTGPAGAGGSDSGVAGYIASSSSATSAALSAKIATLKQWARNPDQLFVGAVTLDAYGAPISAGVVWPDGVAGTYTADTVSTSFRPAVDAFHVTRVVGSTTTTYTQPAVTRDALGNVTNFPAVVIS